MDKDKWGETENKQTNIMIYILMTLIELVIIYKLGKWLNDIERNQFTITNNQQKLVTLITQQHIKTRRMIIVSGRDENGLRYRFEEQSPPEYSETDNSENEEAMLLVQ